MPAPSRYERLYAEPSDQRTDGQRDRDRVLYTLALRRLAGVTQVVGPGEGHLFHNRLTHTFEVAQIARRLAENLKKTKPDLATDNVVDPDIVEAAALIHDLGHPPFGHVAEETLNELVLGQQVDEGYEGNAQSFRIVTKLESRRESYAGLGLTRATLNASLKYPWFREVDPVKKDCKQAHKWGAYRTEQAEFEFARHGYQGSAAQCLEAQIMDWADDIAYSVHDTADFFQAGLIPLDRLKIDKEEVKHFLAQVQHRWDVHGYSPAFSWEEELEPTFWSYINKVPTDRPFDGTKRAREELARFTSGQIKTYLTRTSVVAGQDGRPQLDVPRGLRMQITMLKELTWVYVIENPALAGQQHGQRQVIQHLFKFFLDATADRKRWSVLPASFREEAEAAREACTLDDALQVRLVADLIAGMTDQQAISIFHRLSGISLGTVNDPILA